MDIVILHGTMGSPEGNWFPWLKAEMEKRGHTVYVPRLPTPEGQTKDEWCAALREQAPLFGKDTVLVGHSCGALFVLHILEVVRNPVAKAVLVSPFMSALGNETFDRLNASFVNHDFDWAAVKRNAGEIVLLHGDDDPYVPLAEAQKVAGKVGQPLTIVPGGGHLNAESGFTRFEKLLEMMP